jgi:hypothetical protein
MFLFIFQECPQIAVVTVSSLSEATDLTVAVRK